MSEIKKKHKTSEESSSDESEAADKDVRVSVAPAVDDEGMTMLECLSSLSSFDRSLRLSAASRLVTLLVQEQGLSAEPCTNLQLVVERLAVGLTSGREGSRQGFSVVLSELLRQFPQIGLSKFMSLVDEKMDPTGEKGDVEKQIYLGKIFAVVCVVRSGRLEMEKASDRASLLSQMFGVLVAMFEKKSYMKELVAHTMTELLGLLQSRDDELRKVALPSLSALLSVAPEDCSPESLALLLSVQAEPSTFNAEWTKGVPLLKQSDRIKHALLASSYTHPRVHFVWRLVADTCFGAGSELTRSVWSLIDNTLFGSHVDNRKFLAFSLLAEFVKRSNVVDDVVFFLSQPNTTRALVNHLASSKKTKMTDVAIHALDELKKKVSSSEALGIALLHARYLAPINLDLQIVPILSLEAGIGYLKSLLSGFNKEQGDRLLSAIKRGWKKWGHVEENKAALGGIATEIIHVFAKLAFLSDLDADKQWGKMRLFSVLTEFETTGHANLNALCQWLHPQVGELEAEVKKLVSKANRITAPSNRYETAFSKVVGLVTLLNIQGSDAGDVASVEQLDDSLTAFKKFGAAVKENDLKVCWKTE